jgi:phosphoacetylglucosamine mutase
MTFLLCAEPLLILFSLANVDETQVWTTLVQFAKEKLEIPDLASATAKLTKARVFIGYDTRSSSVRLKNIVIEGVQALGAHCNDHGLVTTPQLHWIVRAFNAKTSAVGEKLTFSSLEASFDSMINLKLYYQNLSESFAFLMSNGNNGATVQVHVDCANGIGAVSLSSLAPYVTNSLSLTLFNDEIKDSSKLNHNAGAEHVQKNRAFPAGVDPSKDQGKRFASIDGDADRLVYFYVGSNSSLQLLDGDKILALSCSVLKDLVSESKLGLEVGVVQTAYANGASTHFLQSTLQVHVACVPTGVKYLHHEAAHFDIGLYFEANGHGTVLFKQSAIDKIQKSKSEGGLAGAKLSAFVKLINQAVGDAVSDLLLVEACLRLKGWTLEDWNSLYTDLPSYQSKVKVKDRSLVKTTDAERKTTSPAGLQEAVDELVSKVSKGRAFVRPSGTEDVVRVYAEAATEELAKKLGQDVEEAIRKYC